MPLKTKIIPFFGKTKVIFASLAMAITFMITIYNQFKTAKATEISGIVSANSNDSIPVDAIVTISSPIQAQTQTDSKGRFKFKLANLQSDTFLLIIQNKTTNTINKQSEYVNASKGRTDIIIVSKSEIKDLPDNRTSVKSASTYKKRQGLRKKIKELFQ